MTEAVTIERIYNELIDLKKEVHFIRKHMVDMDMFLTPKEEAELEESLKELKEEKAFSLEDIKKDRKHA